ncbi:Leucine Rich Repeat family protein [Trichomonas vaginalis G3]|uniref:Leucine Rich Repeat family protein n=1 Tax=Trichomonas vaginalis (strain ATCC PRA-98 / G3) TaxID=412133 RepID=A2EXD2_TRIV3|nr:uncharacterized protein TVAGG3_0676730 [Trichomonas vaginalis G3]EAY02681.1 Leucine Rich Repeat family protein [Trichomonas vaginalis G3]KAI5507587.1 regulation of response to stimulus [Trichomonas vaginalis G3]|eukprot:XP_001314904.1 hypothetical protein [Trichomonas vaginalis G3]
MNERYSNDNLILSSSENSVNVDLKESCETIYGLYAGDGCKDYAFKGSRNTLLSINFPIGSRLSNINDCAFNQCSKLSSIDFSNCEFLTIIGSYAFGGCISLSNIILPTHLKSNSTCCFEYTSITSISIPNDVTSLGSACFQACSKLKNVIIDVESNLKEIGVNAFNGALIETFFIPKSTTKVNEYAFVHSKSLKEFRIDPSNPSYSVSDGVLFNKDQTYLVKFPANKSKTYSIPEKVTSVGSCSFANSIIESIQFSINFRSFGDWAFGGSNLKSVIIPDSVTSLGSGVFQTCTHLNSVVIVKGIYSIPTQTFQNTNISSITIPSGITKIDSYAFYGCNNLKEVVLPSSLKNLGGSCFPITTNLTFSEGPDFTIDNQMIVYNKAKTTVVMCLNESESYIIPSTVQIINNDVFRSNKILRKIGFESESQLTDIYEGAFAECEKLSSINIPLSVSKFGKNSFSGCKLLQYIFFGNNLSSISDNCFKNCNSLTTITFNDIDGNAIIGQYAFIGCNSLTSVTLRNGISSLDMFCFSGCTSLNRISIPSTVVFIGTNAFQNTNIETITFSSDSHMHVLSQYVFSGCNTLRNIENIPSGIESIESGCFEFTSLETFTVPVSTISISDYAFRGYSSLRVFTIPSGCLLSNIGNFIFTGCTSLSAIECVNSEHFVIDNGALFNKNRSNLIYFPPASSIKFFCFSQNVKSVSSSAFFGCKHLEGIMIPDNSIETIGFSAFSECTSLKYINIPLCVKTIEQNAFAGCINLQCGVNIQNQTRSFIDNIVSSSGLSITSLKSCSIITCKQIHYQNSVSKSYLYVFVLM